MAITADRVLAGVKRRAVVPTNQVTLDDDDILDFIDDVIKVHVVPLVDSVNGEFFVTSELDALVASQDNYDIPYRSIGRTLRDLKIKNTTSLNTRNCPYIEPEDIHLYSDTALDFGHYFKGDQIYMVPSVPSTFNAAESLEKWYKIRPSSLIKLNNAAKVVSVSSPNITVDAAGDVVTGSVIDFIKGKSGNSIYSIDKTCTNVSSTTFTFAAADIPTSLVAGDYIALAGFSPVITMIPDECSPWVERLAAREVLLAIGDDIGADKLAPGIAQERTNLLQILEPRNEGEPKIIINRGSLARGGKFHQRRWLYGGS
tara:strand:- start:1296 stop:2237 length:942 start_codon:yes stop_codon:yes gene_type:complete